MWTEEEAKSLSVYMPKEMGKREGSCCVLRIGAPELLENKKKKEPRS